ncbi:antA/AntB antirepressor family protein [Methylovulum psychrotolerans]|nr:antA/AntB antirepressor family protein [Methylovulum psychrotolerans]
MTKTDADAVGIGVGGDAPMLMPSGADGLVPVLFMAEIGGTLRPAVDARALHRFLGVKQDFLVWVKNRMAEYGFIEGLDFLPPQMGEQENAGLQTTIDYHLSLDMANVLAMVEKSDQGRAALLARTGQTRPEAPPPDAGKVVPLPADRVPVLLAVLVALGVFWGLAFSCHGP